MIVKRLIYTFHIMFRYARAMTLSKIVLMISNGLSIPINLLLLQSLIDTLSSRNEKKIYFLIVAYVSSLLIIAILNNINQVIDIRLKRKLYENFTDALLYKLKNIEYRFFEDEEYHNTLQKMGNAPQEKIFSIFISFAYLLSSGFSLFSTVVIFSQINIMIPIIYILLILPIIYIECKSMDLYYHLDNEISDDLRKMWYLSNLLTDKISLYELKVFRATKYILDKWKFFAEKVLLQRVSTTKKARNYHLVSSFIGIIWAIIVIVFLCSYLLKDKISYGTFVSLIGTISTVISLTNAISSQTSSITKNHLDILHYEEFMALPEVDNSLEKKRISNFTIRFDNVYFRYPNTEKDILKGVSFCIDMGEKVAIVGRNGEGKSTIIKLLCGLFKPNSGRILVGDIDINDIPQNQLNEIFSVVFQDYKNYWLTLRENVSLCNIKQLNNDAAILKAIQHGMAEDILITSPKGLDTSLGKLSNDGVDLSGGQWQRVALSRALLSNSPFIILDEPTANLDPVAESDMYESFTKVIHDRGCLLISHRLGSAKIANRILVIDDGIVYESGTHFELMKKGGIYAKMFLSQQSWYKEDNS